MWLAYSVPQYVNTVKNDGHLVLRKDIQCEATKYLRSVRKKYSVDASSEQSKDISFISIHLRRGDRVDKFNTDIGGFPIPNGWYIAAMEEMVEFLNITFEECIFIIVSDDVPFIRKNIEPRMKTIHPDLKYSYANDYKILEDTKKNAKKEISRKSFDFGILMSCNHSIFDISSFGYYGAVLANGYTVFPKDFKYSEWYHTLERGAWDNAFRKSKALSVSDPRVSKYKGMSF